MSAPPDGRYRVRSVDRAVDILEILGASRDGLSVTDVAARAGGSKSAVFATLQTLAERDLVRVSGAGQDRRYRLGLGLARLGERAIGQVSFREAIMPVLRLLSAETGATARAGAWGGDCAVVVARVNSASGVKFDLHMGSQEQLHCTAIGKAMLFPLEDEQVRAILENVPLPKRTPHTLVAADDILEDLARARIRGYAIDDEEDAQGIICVGAPVYDHRGEVAGAISVTRIKSTLSYTQVEALGQITARHGMTASAGLGWNQPSGSV